MNENTKINFGLHKVTTEQFAIVSEFPKEDKEITLNTAYRFVTDIEHRAIATFLKVSFDKIDSPFLIIETGNHFIIEDKSWEKIYNEENKELIIPKGFASHLLMISMGTARGILHCKTENTPYNKYLLPLMNVADMVKSKIQIKVDQVKRTNIEL